MEGTKLMLASRSFISTRKPAYTIHQITLLSDMTKAAKRNIELYNAGENTSRYHFHILNKYNIYVTVILSKHNMVCVRGKYCRTFDQMFKMIESHKV